MTIITHLVLLFLVLAAVEAEHPDLIVEDGQLTFDAEGNDNPRSQYFSRRLHVPSRWSGITVGRGYDIKYKTKYAVFRDLIRVGIASWIAEKISGGVGKSGSSARKYIRDNNLKNTIITRLQQKELFKITYRNEAKEAKRLINKYYKISWGPLYKKIKEILVDLKYRGDFRPRSKRPAMGLLRAAVKSNSLRYLKRVMGTKRLWRNVPKYRFIARRDYLNRFPSWKIEPYKHFDSLIFAFDSNR